MYRRLIRGIVERGQTGELLAAARVAFEHQDNRGIRARTALWAAMTGPTNAVSIVMDFNTLEELERFDDLALQDSEFARFRRATREAMAFLTTHVELMRNVL